MKRLESLTGVITLNRTQQKAVFGGDGGDPISGGDQCSNTGCEGKSSGHSCTIGGKPGKCKMASCAGTQQLLCYWN